MIETFLLRDLAVVMIIAAAATLLCQRFRQPVVIGYLLAGLIIGPYTPPFSFVRDLDSIHTMAELGLVFLMFALGLEFSLPKLRRVGKFAGLAASFEVLGMLGIGYFLGRLFGWSQTDSIFLGAILSMSSTTIIIKVFMDMNLLKERFVQIVFGILILEDIVAVLILSFLSGLGASGEAKTGLLLTSMVKIGFFIILFLVFGLLLIPRLLHWVAHFKVKEMMGIVTLGLCLGCSWLASYFGFSVALGAFLIGAVIAASQEIEQITEWIHPVRDMFSAIFFVSAGMLIQPSLLWEYKWLILIIAVATLIGKVVTDAAGSFLAGLDLKTSFKIGVSLGQIGEFSFVIAALGASLKVTSDFFFPIAVAVSSLTTFCTPYLIRNANGLVEVMMRITPIPVKGALNRYQVWSARPVGSAKWQQATSVISKYLVRLIVYIVILASILLLTRGVLYVIPSEFPISVFFLILTLVVLVCLPLFFVVARYGNHILLLLVTQIPIILRIFNISFLYNAMLCALFGIIGITYAVIAHSVLGSWALSWSLVGIATLVGVVFRKTTNFIVERMERVLDEIMGLATSEPTRKAVLSIEQTTFLRGVMEPVALKENSPAIQKTIRSLRLREETGSSIVAIYREGKHISNPPPDTVFMANDILIVMGNDEERGKAKEALLGGGD